MTTVHLRDERLQRIADGDAADAPERGHLDDCSDCRAEVDAYRALGEALAAVRPTATPEGFTATVMARIGARERSVRRQLVVLLGVPVAAMVALGAIAPGAILLNLWDGVRSAFDVGRAAARVIDLASPFVATLGPVLALFWAVVAALLVLRPAWRMR